MCVYSVCMCMWSMVCVCVVYGVCVYLFSEGAVETAMKDAFLTLCS